jgi:hypothetical protein
VNRLELEQLEARDVPSVAVSNFADGLWRYDSATTSWAHLSSGKASEVAVDNGGNVFGTFADGLWRWNLATQAWGKLSNGAPSEFEVTAGGVFYGNFGNVGTSGGVWRWDPAAGWARISIFGPDHLAVSDSDVVFASFSSGGAGTWRWAPGAGWTQLSDSQPDGNAFDTDAAGNFVGVFSQHIAASQIGTWRWSPVTGWARLSTAKYAMTLADNGVITEDRDAAGLWLYNPAQANSAFFQITVGNAGFVIPGSDGGVWAVFNNGGQYPLWHYDLVAGWYLITSNVTPYNLVAAGKDGDLYVDRNIQGLWHWSAASGWHPISGSDPTSLTAESWSA